MLGIDKKWQNIWLFFWFQFALLSVVPAWDSNNVKREIRHIACSLAPPFYLPIQAFQGYKFAGL